MERASSIEVWSLSAQAGEVAGSTAPSGRIGVHERHRKPPCQLRARKESTVTGATVRAQRHLLGELDGGRHAASDAT
jgi:hypothetical protein